MSRDYIIESVGLNKLDELVAEGLADRTQKHQYITVAECENCSFNLIGNTEKHGDEIKERVDAHHKETNHCIFIRQRQSYNLKMNKVVDLQEHKEYKDDVIGNLKIIGMPYHKRNELKNDVKSGTMTDRLYGGIFVIVSEAGGRTKGCKQFNPHADYRELEEEVRLFIHEVVDVSDRDYEIRELIVNAIFSIRLEITIKVPDMPIVIETIRG